MESVSVDPISFSLAYASSHFFPSKIYENAQFVHVTQQKKKRASFEALKSHRILLLTLVFVLATFICWCWDNNSAPKPISVFAYVCRIYRRDIFGENPYDDVDDAHEERLFPWVAHFKVKDQYQTNINNNKFRVPYARKAETSWLAVNQCRRFKFYQINTGICSKKLAAEEMISNSNLAPTYDYRNEDSCYHSTHYGTY